MEHIQTQFTPSLWGFRWTLITKSTSKNVFTQTVNCHNLWWNGGNMFGLDHWWNGFRLGLWSFITTIKSRWAHNQIISPYSASLIVDSVESWVLGSGWTATLCSYCCCCNFPRLLTFFLISLASCNTTAYMGMTLTFFKHS